MVEAFGKLPTGSATLDGELVLIDPRGSAHFYRVMAQMRTSHPDETQLMFLAFDLLHQDGVDLRALPDRLRVTWSDLWGSHSRHNYGFLGSDGRGLGFYVSHRRSVRFPHFRPAIASFSPLASVASSGLRYRGFSRHR
jgi:hypothetical protein